MRFLTRFASRPLVLALMGLDSCNFLDVDRRLLRSWTAIYTADVLVMAAVLGTYITMESIGI